MTYIYYIYAHEYFEKHVTINYFINYTESAKKQILELHISHYLSAFNANESKRKHNF